MCSPPLLYSIMTVLWSLPCSREKYPIVCLFGALALRLDRRLHQVHAKKTGRWGVQVGRVAAVAFGPRGRLSCVV